MPWGFDVDEKPGEPEENESLDRALDAVLRPSRNASLVTWTDGANTIDFSDAIPLYDRVPPHRRVLLLVLLLTLKDRASELRFEPSLVESGGYDLRLYYMVDSQLHELVSPPQEVAEAVLREIKTVAGLRTMRRRLADSLRRFASQLDAQAEHTLRSCFRMRAGEDSIEISAVVFRSANGDRVFLNLPVCSASLSQKAHDALKAILDPHAEPRTRNE